MFDLRLVAYAPNGDKLGLLPHPLAFQAGQPLNDVPALALRYSRHALGAGLLAQPCEIAIEWSEDGQTWTESPDSRFLRIKRGMDVTDETGVETFEMPGYGWQLRKVVLYPGPAPLVDGKRAFTSATPGSILQTFLAEAQERGALPVLDWTFNTEHDSDHKPWNKILTIYYQPGLDALTTLINLAEQSVIDFRFEGRTLHVYNADTKLARDRTTAPRVDLRLGRDVLDAPDTGTLKTPRALCSSWVTTGSAGRTAPARPCRGAGGRTSSARAVFPTRGPRSCSLSRRCSAPPRSGCSTPVRSRRTGRGGCRGATTSPETRSSRPRVAARWLR
ncbi:hypothetical protein ACFQX6_10935 [Streptosporangium lutulentum]